MKEDTIKDVVKGYYKWRSIASLGIWIGAGIASLFAGDEARVAIICLASLAFLLSLIIGVPEIEIKQKVSSVEEEA